MRRRRSQNADNRQDKTLMRGQASRGGRHQDLPRSGDLYAGTQPHEATMTQAMTTKAGGRQQA